MKVSDSRKIHIIALPHDTWKALRSLDQSDTSPRRPAGGTGGVVAVEGTSWIGRVTAFISASAKRRGGDVSCEPQRSADEAGDVGREPAHRTEKRDPHRE